MIPNRKTLSVSSRKFSLLNVTEDDTSLKLVSGPKFNKKIAFLSSCSDNDKSHLHQGSHKLSAQPEFTSSTNLMMNQLSKAGFESPSYFTDDFTKPVASADNYGIYHITNPFSTENGGTDERLIGKGLNKTKSYNQSGKHTDPKKKVKIEEAHCAHDGNCDVCYKCRKCIENNRKEKVEQTKVRKECKPCVSLHKAYCKIY